MCYHLWIIIDIKKTEIYAMEKISSCRITGPPKELIYLELIGKPSPHQMVLSVLGKLCLYLSPRIR